MLIYFFPVNLAVYEMKRQERLCDSVTRSRYSDLLRAGRSGDRILGVGGGGGGWRDLPWGPPSLLCNGYRVSFPGVKRPGRGVDHPPPSSAEVKEKVKLYLYSPSGPSWPVLE